jgi:hypothetical protein
VVPPAIGLVVGLHIGVKVSLHVGVKVGLCIGVEAGLRELGFGFEVGKCVASAELNWGS